MTPLEITVTRMSLLPDRAIGKLQVGDVWACWTLEDAVREIDGRPVSEWKIKKETAIPCGRYRVTFEDSSTFGRDTLTLNDVPGYSLIRIHGGNTPGDTEGCLLVGMAYRGESNTIGNCKPALQTLKEICADAINDGDEVWVTIK